MRLSLVVCDGFPHRRPSRLETGPWSATTSRPLINRPRCASASRLATGRPCTRCCAMFPPQTRLRRINLPKHSAAEPLVPRPAQHAPATVPSRPRESVLRRRRRQTGRPAAHLRGRLRRRFRSRHLQTGHPAERRRAPTPNERCFNRRAGTNTFPEERLCGQTGHPTTRRCGQTGGRHRRRHQGRRPRAAPPPLRCRPCRCRRRCRRRASACRWSGRIPPGRS